MGHQIDMAAIILAAGQGTRMKSSLPKVLHPVAGRPMLGYAVRLARHVATHTVAIVVDLVFEDDVVAGIAQPESVMGMIGQVFHVVISLGKCPPEGVVG